MVDHDSRKRVAKNFRHFFSFKISYFYFSRAPRSRALNFFQNFPKILRRFHQVTQQQQPATSSSQQPAAASSNTK
jgi:hypothetical protein